jgi:hypothetical protein
MIRISEPPLDGKKTWRCVAAAPLGTDEEAAGTPASPAAVETAHRNEVRSSPVSSERNDSDHAIAIYLGLIAIIVANVGLAIWLA